MKKKSKAAFLANLKAMPDCDEKEKLLKSLEDEPEEDDDDDPDGSMEKSLDTTGLSKALDALDAVRGQTPAAAAPLGQRLENAGDVDLAKSMDATGFVRSLVDQAAAHADDLGAAVGEVSQQQAINNDAVLATGKLTVALVKSFGALNEKLDRLIATAGAPAAPRTVTAAPMNKSFNAGGGAPAAASLSKSQLANAINGELKKSMEAGDTARAHQLQNSVALLMAGRKDAIATEIEQTALRQAKG